MSTMDIRNEQSLEIEKIVFTDDNDPIFTVGHSVVPTTERFILIEDAADYVRIRKSDIPNLIKALQKAQEIWGE